MPSYTLFNNSEINVVSENQDSEADIIKLPTIQSPSTFHLNEIWKKNPFTLPAGMGWVDLCQVEKVKSLLTRREERKKKVYKQHTYASRHTAQALPKIRQFFDSVDNDIKKEMKEKEKSTRDPALTESQKIRVRPVEKESTYDLIQRKKEMFLVNFTLQTKKNEITEYKMKEEAEEKRVLQLTERLRKEAHMFDDFLKSTDAAAVEARKRAEKETKLKLEKTAELRRMQGKVGSLKAELSKQDEILAEYLGYKCFLLRFYHSAIKKNGIHLTNEQWVAKRDQERKKKVPVPKKPQKPFNPVIEEKRRRSSVHFRRQSYVGMSPKSSLRKLATPKVSEPTVSANQAFSKTAYPEEWEEDEKESTALTERLRPVLNDVKWIINVIHEKEEENLKLIYHFHSSQDALDDLKSAHRRKIMLLDKEILRLKDQVTLVESNILCEEERSQDLQLMCKILAAGDAITEEEDVEILTAKVEKVYLNVFGRVIVNIDSLTMLTCIEKRMDQLIDELEVLPEETVNEIKKIKDKERRLAQREEKIQMHKQKQDERTKRALQRANKNTTKKLRRKLVFRSAPARVKEKISVTRGGSQLSETEQFLEPLS